ncbi:hypothetical protein ACH95_14395 [Bacillus glycinifermentans]|uniref:Uncharacterized protein n=1 Tax=Bacillus glycinifermentans TaxID=1664069 RepID=A0A0J6EC93_9BACI|nr:hypothetical protein [Bacillus glycinifermentans]ATH91193.1 hypothetical protein COP00_00125 [Bacillus glycinifermentans]KMM58101.1 hypothetical protein ACH95_14395 [Bacillus glycinifermentans]KRT93522.1 hypothetical protein AB447_219270 [Bacillus glycinifermentans]MEC0485515.1 hypothetical protein [Bacillus glycinifermentans]MEC0495300.1 hypothetical protein [Bacillus glycinifermentans]
MEPKGNNEPSPRVVKWLTWIIPIVIIGLIFLLKNINNPVTDILFYIVCASVIILVVFSIIKEKKAKSK